MEKKRASLKKRQKLSASGEQVVSLRLYVAGSTPRSILALQNLRKICADHLDGKYLLEVIDLSKNPSLAAGDQIIAIPTLVRTLPKPFKRIIGDLADTERVLIGLDLCAGRPSS